MREGTIPPNCTDIVRCRPQSGALDNIDLKDTWFTPDLEEYPIETLAHVPRVAPENNMNMIILLQFVQQVKESPFIEGESVSQVIKHPVSEGVRNTSNLPKVIFSQQSSNVPSRLHLTREKKDQKCLRS